MVIKEIIGIHLGKDALHYCCAVRTLSSWEMGATGASMDASGVIQGHSSAALREFLQRISPKSGRRILLTLPRNRFFIRDIQLPAVPLEDALMSVQSALPVNCHLPLDDIYHDIYLCRLQSGSISALVVYALRKDIAPILEIFQETGHEKSLIGLFPVCLGIGAWLNLQKYDMPMGLVISLESPAGELAVYQPGGGCVYSLAWQNAFDAGESAAIKDSACARFQLPADSMYGLDLSSGFTPLPDPLQDRLPGLPPLRINPGVAALAPAISDHQVLLLNGGLPRIKMFRLWKLFVPLVFLLSVLLMVSTVVMQRSIDQQKQILSVLKEDVQQLQQQIRPLETRRDILKKTESLSADIEDFIRLRPRLFSCFNEIARLVPDETWFSRSSFQGTELTLQGQSRDALKAVESLRTSPLFEQVKLSGSVSRAPSGVEQFSLSIRLKDVETNP